jgi:hypothetical protein
VVSRNIQFIEMKDAHPCLLHPGIVANGDENRDDEEEECNLHPIQISQPTQGNDIPEPGSNNGVGELAEDLPDVVPGPRHSTCVHAPLAVGAASKGIAHDGPMDRVRREVQGSVDQKKATKTARIKVVNVVQEGESEEFFLSAEDDDPQTYKQVMVTDYAAQWDVGYDEEIASLKAHNVWTLFPGLQSLLARRLWAVDPISTPSVMRKDRFTSTKYMLPKVILRFRALITLIHMPPLHEWNPCRQYSTSERHLTER